jgi:hypothetical protein
MINIGGANYIDIETLPNLVGFGFNYSFKYIENGIVLDSFIFGTCTFMSLVSTFSAILKFIDSNGEYMNDIDVPINSIDRTRLVIVISRKINTTYINFDINRMNLITEQIIPHFSFRISNEYVNNIYNFIENLLLNNYD